MAYLGKPAGNRATGTSKDSFNGDGSTTAFTMSRSVLLVTDIEVFVDNVQQEPTTAYTVSATTLTFDEAPPNGTANVYVIHRSGNNDSMTVQSGITPTFQNVIIANDGTIGSASDNDAISINSSGRVTLTNNLTIPNDGNIGSVGDADAIAISSAGVATFNGGIKVANDGNIGSVGDADSMAISSGGVVTFSQIPTNANNPAFSVRLGSNQGSISDVTATKIELDTVEFDVGNYFDESTNYRYTPQIAGYYFFTGKVDLGSSVVTSAIYAQVNKNGSTTLVAGVSNSVSSSEFRDTIAEVSGIIYMNGSSDYVELFGYLNTGGSAGTFQGGTGYASTTLQGFLVNRTG